MTTYTTTSAMRVKIVLALIAATFVVVFFAGCGGTSTATVTKADRLLEARPLDLLLPDCSASFRAALPGFAEALHQIVSDSAARGRFLWMTCFDGSPLRTASFDPKVDFGILPKSVAGKEQLASRFTEARALGTVERIEKAVSATQNQVSGSGQLEALEVASKTPDTGRLFLLTDLMVNEVDGLTPRFATEADIRQTVKRWLPRLGNGLQGVQVFIVGVGLGARSSEAVRNVGSLFAQLVTKAGGKVSITQELPASLVLDGGES